MKLSIKNKKTICIINDTVNLNAIEEIINSIEEFDVENKIHEFEEKSLKMKITYLIILVKRKQKKRVNMMNILLRIIYLNI